MKGAAKFSANKKYRYLLTRRWEAKPHYVNFVMLNPSTADARVNDPTIRRCIGFAQRLGFGGLMVTNLFAYRTKSPKVLKTAENPVGTQNDYWVKWAAGHCEQIIVAWGNQGRHYPERIQKTLMILGYPFGRELLTFGFTRNGQPFHPLMLPLDAEVDVYEI